MYVDEPKQSEVEIQELNKSEFGLAEEEDQPK